MHSLRLLGEVSTGSHPAAVQRQLARPRSVALLAVLAASEGDGVTRDRLTALLWEDADRGHARHSLSNQLHILRTALGSDAISTHGDFVRLNTDVAATDVTQFRQACRSGAFERAADAYSGPLLDGFHLDGSNEFERWLETERQLLSLQALEVFETLAERAAAENEPDRAVKWLQRAVHHDPYNSRAAVALATALAAWRDPGNGVQLLREHVNRLKEDLGIEPDPEILTLIETGDFGVDQHVGFAKRRPAGEPGNPRAGSRRSARRSGRVRLLASAAAACVVAVAAGSVASRLRGGEQFDPDLIAVLPVRAVGVDSLVAVLATERLNAELADWQELRIAQPEQVEGVWRSFAAGLGGGPSPEIARRVGTRIGSGVVLTARVAAAEYGIELYGSLVDVQSGAVLASARSKGGLERLSFLSHAMAVHLFAEWRGIPSDRMATLEQHDPDAVRLFITAHPHEDARGDRLLNEAIARDSSFALAALELYESFPSYFFPDADDPAAVEEATRWDRVASVIWRNRETLSAADRAYAEARVGWRYRDGYTARLHVAAWEQAVRVAPDRVAHWKGLVRECYRWCSSYRRGWRQPLLEAHDSLLARGDTSYVEAAMEVAFVAGDTARLRSYAELLPDDGWYGRWLAALGLGRDEDRATIRAALPEMSNGPLMRIGNAAIMTGLGLEDAERVASESWRGPPGSIYSLRKLVVARERGRHAEYRRLRDQLFQYFDTRSGLEAIAAANVIFEWGFLGEPESNETLDRMDRVLSEILLNGQRGSPDSLAIAYCYRSQLRLLREDTTGVAEAVHALTLEPAINGLAAARMCAPFLRYLADRRRDDRAYSEAAQILHDVMRDRPMTLGRGSGLTVVEMNLAGSINLALGKSLGDLGYPQSGIQLVERRPYQAGLWGLYGFHIEFVREEARLLALAGETDAALERYEKYFRLRPQPPDLESWADTWHQVRQEYESLVSPGQG